MILTHHNIKQLIDDLGRQVTINFKTIGGYDPTTGSISGTTSSTRVAKAYLANYKLQDFDGDSVVFGDRKVYLSAYDTSYSLLPEPKVGDEIVNVADKTRIIAVQKVYQGAQVVCYICQVRE